METAKLTKIKTLPPNRHLFLKKNPENECEKSFQYHNFDRTLPGDGAKQVELLLKYRYNLGFLNAKHGNEQRINKLLGELGKGFCFVGNQYEINYRHRIFRAELLLYHRTAASLINVFIRPEPFQTGWIGEMATMLNIINKTIRQKAENKPIGLILCSACDTVKARAGIESVNFPVALANAVFE